MKILIANDHAGFALKKQLISFFDHVEFIDLGADSDISSDYPLYAKKLCDQMDVASLGILICGSGMGICIAANRFKHIRAAVCHSVEEALLARRHNNMNVLCLAARAPDPHKEIVQAFLTTPFLREERHVRRIHMMG